MSYIKHTEQPVVAEASGELVRAVSHDGAAVELAARRLPGVRFAKVDTDAELQTASEWGIRSIPTVILFTTVGKFRGKRARCAAEIINGSTSRCPGQT